jgi:hypothetical protein
MLFRRNTGLLQLHSNPCESKGGVRLWTLLSDPYARGGIRLFAGAVADAWRGAADGYRMAAASAHSVNGIDGAGISDAAGSDVVNSARGFNVQHVIFGTFTTPNSRKRRGQSHTRGRPW